MQSDHELYPTATSEDLASLFRTLANPKRLAILRLLEGHELCVCDIEERLGLRQAYVSQQMGVLREAGLVCYRKDGWNVWYRIARPKVYTLLQTAASIHQYLGVCAVTPEELTSSPGLFSGQKQSGECKIEDAK